MRISGLDTSVQNVYYNSTNGWLAEELNFNSADKTNLKVEFFSADGYLDASYFDSFELAPQHVLLCWSALLV